MEGYSQQLQFIHDCGLFIISFNFASRDFNVSLKLYAVIKIRGKWKIAQLANFPLLSRQLTVCCNSSNLQGDKSLTVCRNSSNLQGDKSSPGCDLLCFN